MDRSDVGFGRRLLAGNQTGTPGSIEQVLYRGRRLIRATLRRTFMQVLAHLFLLRTVMHGK